MIKTAAHDEPPKVQVRITRRQSQVWSRQVDRLKPDEVWSPPVNIYQLQTRLDVCIDLAGVDADSVEVRLASRQLTVRGVRQAPDPRAGEGESMRIVSMEIDHGRFCRIIELPHGLDPAGAQTAYVQGLLWIRLPIRVHG